MPKSAKELLEARIQALDERSRLDSDVLLQKIADGSLVEDFIADLRLYGKNEFGDLLRWDEPCFEEALRVIGDLRIARTYLSGCSQRFKGNLNTDFIPTPSGLKQVKDIKVGDYFISVDGTPTKVLGVHPLGMSKTYKVTFKDGTYCIVTDEHLWTWYAPGAHSPSKLTSGCKGKPKAQMYWTNNTKELLEDAISSGGFRQQTKNGKLGRYKYAIPQLRGPAMFNNGFDCENVDPYLLGLLIGDGNYSSGARLTGADDDLKFYQTVVGGTFRKNTDRCSILYFEGIVQKLKQLGVHGQTGQNKRIPEECFFMSWEKRLELLRGLMDSDGSVKIDKGVATKAVFCNCVKEIAEGVARLVRELGGYATVKEYRHSSYAYKDNPNKECIFYHVSVKLYFNPFKLPRKASLYQNSECGKSIKAIVSIEAAADAECTCFTVEHVESLYLMCDGVVTHNTAASAQMNAWMSQRAGVRTLWAFPKARMMELLVPKQHRSLLTNWAKVSGITKFTRNMLQSNSQFDVGIAAATFTHVNSNEGGSGAAAGTSVVAVTADVVFAEEASQSSHTDILPLYRRVDASRVSTRPTRWLGTPSGGGGIEAKIADAEYEFWPHAECQCCGQMASLHPLGALLTSKQERAEDGTLITKWAHEDGTPVGWFCYDQEDPINTAFVGCVHCGNEIPDRARYEATFICIKTGVSVETFLSRVVPDVWREKQLEVGLWVGALSRPRAGIAQEILAEMNPEGITDWYQQRLGIPSSAMANSISTESLIQACQRTPYKAKEDEKTVRMLGIDQGRQHWYGAVVEFIYNAKLPPEAMYATARRNIIYLDSFPSFSTPELIQEWQVNGGLIDNEPSISSAAVVARHTGLSLADQQPKLKDDYTRKVIMDGGERFDCLSIKYKKYARYIFQLFASGRISVNNEYLRFASGAVKHPADVFKHLTRVEWDSETGDIIRAKDKVDDLFFALMFAEAAFGIYTIDPGAVSCSSYSWDWMLSW